MADILNKNYRPVVSVILAVYNGENDVKETVDSVLSQDYKNFELVIVDDASTDATKEILSRINDDRVIVIANKENKGQTKSLNIGINSSKGEYLSRIDSGDLMLPGRLERQVVYLEENPDVIIVGTKCRVRNVNTGMVSVVSRPADHKSLVAYSVYRTPLLHVSVTMRAKEIKSIGLYNEDYKISADYDLWSRAIMSGMIISNIPDILTEYIVVEGSYASSNRKVSHDEKMKIIRKNIEANGVDIKENNLDLLVSYLYHGMSEKTCIDILRALYYYFYNIVRITKLRSGSYYFLFLYQPFLPFMREFKQVVLSSNNQNKHLSNKTRCSGFYFLFKAFSLLLLPFGKRFRQKVVSFFSSLFSSAAR